MRTFATQIPDAPLTRGDLPAWGDVIRNQLQQSWTDEPGRWDLMVLQLRGPSKRHPLDQLFNEVVGAAEGVVLDRAFNLKTVAIRANPDITHSQLKLVAL